MSGRGRGRPPTRLSEDHGDRLRRNHAPSRPSERSMQRRCSCCKVPGLRVFSCGLDGHVCPNLQDGVCPKRVERIKRRRARHPPRACVSHQATSASGSTRPPSPSLHSGSDVGSVDDSVVMSTGPVLASPHAEQSVEALAKGCWEVFSSPAERYAPGLVFGGSSSRVTRGLKERFRQMFCNILHHIVETQRVRESSAADATSEEVQAMDLAQEQAFNLLGLLQVSVCACLPSTVQSDGGFEGTHRAACQAKRFHLFSTGQFDQLRDQLIADAAKVRLHVQSWRHQSLNQSSQNDDEDALAYTVTRDEEWRHRRALKDIKNLDFAKGMTHLINKESMFVHPVYELNQLKDKQYPRKCSLVDEDCPALRVFAKATCPIDCQCCSGREKVLVFSKEVIEFFQRMPRGKAPGPDGWRVDDLRDMCLPGGPVDSNGEPEHDVDVVADIAAFLTLIANASALAPGVRCRLGASSLLGIGKAGSSLDAPKIRPIGMSSVFTRMAASSMVRRYKHRVDSYLTSCFQFGMAKAGTDVAGTIADLLLGDPNQRFVALSLDFKDAFQTIDRTMALHQISRYIPPLLPMCVGLYNCDAPLFHHDKMTGKVNTLMSEEGARQGCPLSSIMCCLVIAQILEEVKRRCTGSDAEESLLAVNKVFFADDGVLIGEPEAVSALFPLLCSIAKEVGGMVMSPDKCKFYDPHGRTTAGQIPNGVILIPKEEGFLFAGRPIGTPAYENAALQQRFADIRLCFEVLKDYASVDRHGAYLLLQMCVCSKLVFCERFAGESAVEAFGQIRDEMAMTFCSLAGVDLDLLDSRSARKEQLFLKLRDGGFNLRDPGLLAPAAYCAAFTAFVKSPGVSNSYPSLKPVLRSIRDGQPVANYRSVDRFASSWTKLMSHQTFKTAKLITDLHPVTSGDNVDVAVGDFDIYAALLRSSPKVKGLQRDLCTPLRVAMRNRVLLGLSPPVPTDPRSLRTVHGLASFRSAGGTMWPVAPVSNPRARLTPDQFRVCANLRLGFHGCPPLLGKSCVHQSCNRFGPAVVDRTGAHLLTCPHGGKTYAHHTLQNQLYDVCRSASVTAAKEMPVDIVTSDARVL